MHKSHKPSITVQLIVFVIAAMMTALATAKDPITITNNICEKSIKMLVTYVDTTKSVPCNDQTSVQFNYKKNSMLSIEIDLDDQGNTVIYNCGLSDKDDCQIKAGQTIFCESSTTKKIPTVTCYGRPTLDLHKG